MIQRSLKGYTKSFVNKGESITSDRVKRNSSFEDYFALKSQIKGTIKNWDLEIEKNLNSFDFQEALETVTIDLTKAHIWDISSVAALDTVIFCGFVNVTEPLLIKSPFKE